MTLQAQAAGSSPERIGFGKRLLAALLDVFIVCIVGGVTGAVFGGALGGMLGAGAGSRPDGAAVGGIVGGVAGFVIGIRFVAIVYGLWEGLTGAAAGKRAMGIRIANENGSRATTEALMTRYAIKNMNFMLFIACALLGIGALDSIGKLAGSITFIGCFFVLGEKRQAFHDTLAKTAVFNISDIR